MLTQELIAKLYTGNALSHQQAKALFGFMASGQLSDIELTSILTAMKVRGEHINEISGAAEALRDAAKAFPRPAGELLDIVGTGGDGANTINISTTAAFVAAAGGARVAKHGSRSVSSKSGASDLLTEFGVNLTMSAKRSAKLLEELGVTFLFAPHYHAGMRYAIAVRQAMKTRTLFNLLGPLINPAKPNLMLLGVYDKALINPIAEVLKTLKVRRALIVNGAGLDEIAIHDKTDIVELNQGQLVQKVIEPKELGIKRFSLSQIQGGEPAKNKAISEAILAGSGTDAQNAAIAVNAGAALYLAQKADSLRAGTELALDILKTGNALALLNTFAKESL